MGTLLESNCWDCFFFLLFYYAEIKLLYRWFMCHMNVEECCLHL